MNTQISKISEIMEDIKQDITNNQYKIIMDNLMIDWPKMSTPQSTPQSSASVGGSSSSSSSCGVCAIPIS